MNSRLKLPLCLALFISLTAVLNNPLYAQTVDNPAVLQAVAPIFPIPGKGNIAVGKVVIEVQIDSKGVVTHAKAVQGHPALYGVSERAAKRWVFAAALNSEMRVIRLTFIFRIVDVVTPQEDLGPIFSLPYNVEIRSIGRLITTRDT